MKQGRIAVVLLIVCSAFAFAQDGGDNPLDFGLGLTIGSQSFPNPDFTGAEGESETITYDVLGFTPDLSLGKLGVGLDVTLNYRLRPGEEPAIEIRTEDWVPDDTNGFLEIYLPKIRYLRWGVKGDPLYVLFGQVDNGYLGNGFIVGGYANTQYLPVQKIFGVSLDVDGQLFNFPYLGIETFVGNLSALDVIAGRLYVRPLVGTSIPIVKNLQVGTTYAMDRDPFYFADKYIDPAVQAIYLPEGASAADAGNVTIWGADVQIPILTNPVVSLATFGDYVLQGGDSSGGMVGLGGQLFSIIPYRAELRFLGANFEPNYFDATYDVFRPRRYAKYQGIDSTGYIGDITGDGEPDGENFATDPTTAWFARTGFNLLDNQIVFGAQIEGPFVRSGSTGSFPDPDLRADLLIAEGLLGGFSMGAFYEKEDIQDWADLVSRERAVVGARVSYNVEGAVITLNYDLQPNLDPDPGEKAWIVTSNLGVDIELF